MIDTNKYSKDTTTYSDNYNNSRELLKPTSDNDPTNADYNNALNTYKTQLNGIKTSRDAYLKRIGSTNQYRNKTVKFANGVLAYVTNQGYVKKIPDGTSIGAYPQQTPVNLSELWDNSPINTIITVNGTQLVIGTPMTRPNQTIGNEGDNVLYNSFSNTLATEQGCFADTSLTYDVGASNVALDDCRKTAIYRGKQYYGLKNGLCGVADAIPDKTSTTNKENILWQSVNTGQGVTLQLSYDGRLILKNATNNEIYASATPDQPNYMGCFQENRADLKEGFTNMQEGYTSMFGPDFMKDFKLDLGPDFMKDFKLDFGPDFMKGFTLPVTPAPAPAPAITPANKSSTTVALLPPKNKDDDCDAKALQGNYDYYMLDGSNKCFATDVDQTQKSSGLNCTKGTDNIMTGGSSSYAVYLQKKIANSATNAHFYLQVDDDRVCIYRGTPTTPQGLVTTIYTATQSQSLAAFDDWKMGKGKGGKNIILANQTLTGSEWIGSPSGKLRLQLKDGKITILTNNVVSSCSVGSTNTTTIYKINEDVSTNGTKFNTLAFIDADSKLYTYEPDKVEFDSSYNKLLGVKPPSTTRSIETAASCQTKCDASATCVGYSYTSASANCGILSDADVKGGMMTFDTNYYTMLKNKKPKTTRTNAGISSKVVSISSTQYTNYASSGTSYKPDRVGWEQTDNDSQMKIEVDKIIGKQYDTKSSQVQSQYKKNNVDYGDTSAEQKRHDLIEKGIRTDNYDKIVDDSDIVVLQRNSSYLLWSIQTTVTIMLFKKTELKS